MRSLPRALTDQLDGLGAEINFAWQASAGTPGKMMAFVRRRTDGSLLASGCAPEGAMAKGVKEIAAQDAIAKALATEAKRPKSADELRSELDTMRAQLAEREREIAILRERPPARPTQSPRLGRSQDSTGRVSAAGGSAA